MDNLKAVQTINHETNGNPAYMQFSKKIQIVKLLLAFAVFGFSGASWFLYHEIPVEFVSSMLALIGFGDLPYEINSAVEKKARYAAEAQLYSQQEESDI